MLHKTRTPLHLWFCVAYLVTTATPGISARQLQRQLGIERYQTEWTMLHKLRRAMVNPEREPLTGAVEVDDASADTLRSFRGRERRRRHDGFTPTVGRATSASPGWDTTTSLAARGRTACSARTPTRSFPGSTG